VFVCSALIVIVYIDRLPLFLL